MSVAAKPGTNKISTFQWTFWQSPHRQSRKPARAVTPSCALSGRSPAGITSCSCSKHLGTASQHRHIHQAVQGASAFFLKHPKVLSLTEGCPDWEEGSFTPARWLHSPHQGSSHSLPAPSLTGQLFKQLSVSLLPATSIMGSIGYSDNQIQPAHSFFRSIKKPEIDNFSHRITKKGHNQQYSSWLLCKAESLALSWREIWCLPLYRSLVHPAISSNRFIRHCSWHARHLQCRPSSCIYTYQNSTEENQKQVLMKTKCLDNQQLFFLSSPWIAFFSPPKYC